MSEDYKFKITKEDVSVVMKKNTKARADREFEKALQKINDSTNKGIGLLLIKNKINRLKEKLIEELEAEKESIIKASHDRKEIETELVCYMKEIGEKLKDIVKINEGFKINNSDGIYNSSIQTNTRYYNTSDLTLEFRHRNQIFFSVEVEIKNQQVLNYKMSATNSKAHGTTELIKKNEKYFADILNQLNIPEIYKMNLIMSQFYKKNNNKNGIYGLSAIQNFLSKKIPENKNFKEHKSLMNELEMIRDMVELDSDLRLVLLSEEGLEKIRK